MIQLTTPKSNFNNSIFFSDSILGQEYLGIEDISFGTPIIYNNLPSDMRQNITREREHT